MAHSTFHRDYRGWWIALALTALVLGQTACGRSGHFVGVAPPVSPEMSQALAEIDAASTPPGVDAAVFNSLKEELKRMLVAQGSRLASTPPVDAASASYLSLDGSSNELRWNYFCTGDYDQNGEVNISDLTPLGLHFRKVGPFAPDSIETVVDGDSNGEINSADITPIGINYKRLVTGYNIYSSLNASDVPPTFDAPNGPTAVLVTTLPISSGTGTGRKQFSYLLASNPPGTYYWIRPSDGTNDGTPSNYTAPVGDTLPPGGGAVQLDNIVLSIPPGSLVGPVKFTHTLVNPPVGYPADFTPVGQAHDVGLDHPEYLNAPVILQIPYADAGMGANEAGGVVALHYDGTDYAPMTILKQDTAHNILTIDSRQFSIITLGYIAASVLTNLPATYSDGFDPAANGWPMNNFGNYFAPGGNCLGMSAYASWFYDNHSGTLFGHYSTAGGAPVSIAHLTATRAHLAQSQYWTYQFYQYDQELGADTAGRLMQYFLKNFHEPLVLRMAGTPGGHAGVVYGWDATGFTFYDVNFNSTSQHVNWSAAGFGNYAGGYAAPGFTKFGFVAAPSFGRTEDFTALTAEAEGGFASSADISLTSPAPDETVDAREVQLTGNLSGSLNPLTTLLCYVKGQPQTVPVVGGTFSSTIPINNGDNTLILLAGVNVLQQSNWYENCATLIRSVKGTLPDADLLATLTWNQGASDVDLYVTEPGGESAWYSNHITSNGLKLDFDNTSGYGPEHVSLSSAQGGTILAGPYQIRVHYYADHGNGPNVTGNVSVVLNEGKSTQTVHNYPFALGAFSAENHQPGDSGPDWQDIATVTLLPPQP